MRENFVDSVRRRGKLVRVIMPRYCHAIEGVDTVPYFIPLKLCRWLEKIGVLPDYLALWAIVVGIKLRRQVDSETVVFSTSGGELGTWLAGLFLRYLTGCKLVLQSRDPLDKITPTGTLSNALRQYLFRKCLENCDCHWSATLSHCMSLQAQFPSCTLRYCYFGHTISRSNFPKPMQALSKPLTIVYGGTAGSTQSPEILIDAISGTELENMFRVIFFCESSRLSRYESKFLTVLDPISVQEYTRFLNQNADLGYVSLTTGSHSVCIPSKVYEFIGLQIPIFITSPVCEASNIIEEHRFGIHSDRDYDDIRRKLLGLANDRNILFDINDRLRRASWKWHMDVTQKNLIESVSGVKFA